MTNMMRLDSRTKQSGTSSSAAVNTTVLACSWRDYVQVLLMDSGNVARAAIHRLKDGLHMASTDGFSLNREQVDALVQGFEDSTRLRKEGIFLQHDHFTLTRVTDGRIMVGRDETTGFGCVIYRCGTCLLVTCYEEGNHPGGCYSLVTKLGDFLVENGF